MAGGAATLNRRTIALTVAQSHPVPSQPTRRFRLLPPLRRRDLAIHRFDEHLRRPWAGGGAVAPVIVLRRSRCLDLCERPAFRDQILNSIADDRQHVPVLDDIRLVREPP